MDLGLSGRRALVTAASSGLGKACAQALADEGARVVISARSEERLAAAAAEVRAEGYFRADLTRAQEVQSLVVSAADRLGGLDVLVINVPNPKGGSFSHFHEADWQDAHEGTLMSMVRLVREAKSYLADSDSGRVITIGSLASIEFVAERTFSAVYRSAAAALTKHLSIELAGSSITVNTIAPGNIDTPAWDDDSAREAAREVPIGRLGMAQEVGSLCAYLSSPRAAYITGQTVVIDGGLTRTIR